MNKKIYGLVTLCAAALGLSACSGGDPNRPVDIAANPLSTDLRGQPQVSFTSATLSVNEGSSLAVTVSLSGQSSSTITLPFTVTGTASSTDYTISASPVLISGGSGTITVTPVNDSTDEPNKTVVITMGTPVNARLGAVTVTTVTLIDNDLTPGAILGRTTNATSGTALTGVAAAGGGQATTSAATTGAYSLTPVPTSTSMIANYTLSGYASQSRTTPAFSDDFVQVLVNIPMVPVALSDTFDPVAARTIQVAGTPAELQLTGGTLRTEAGAMPSGMVTARVTPVGPGSAAGVLPGNYLAMSGAALAPFESFGALDARFVDATTAELDLAAGSTLTVRIPVSTRSATLPPTATLFYFDTDAGFWRIDGTATLQGTAPNQYYQAAVTHASTTWTAGAFSSTISVTGCVQTASGAPLANALVTSEGTDFTGTTGAVTDATGVFVIPVRAGSNAFLQASWGTFISNSPPIITQGASMTLPTCLLLTPSTISIRLTWGASPLDLDSHTLGANSSDHIFYITRGSLTGLPYVELDVDDVDGNGPEITTFTRLARSRTYSFYVHNFSESANPAQTGTQTGSPARVELTTNGFQNVFTPPGGETSSTVYWHVFDVNTDANCLPTVVPVQQFTATQPLNLNVGNSATFCD